MEQTKHWIGRLRLASDYELSEVLLEIAHSLQSSDGGHLLFSDEEVRDLNEAISKRALQLDDPRAKASCVHVLSRVDPQAAATLADKLLPEAVGNLKAWNALVHETVQLLTKAPQRGHHSSGLPNVENTLKQADLLLSERNLFVPW